MQYTDIVSQLSSTNTNYDLWRDPIWQSLGVVIGVVVGIASILVAVLIAIKQSQKKSLTYKVDSSVILEVADEFRADLQITFKGSFIDSLMLVLVKFSNNGNTSIEKKDYDRPLVVDFGDQAEVLSFNIVVQSPEDLSVVLKSNNNKAIEIEPLLLNQKDYFILQALVSCYSSTVVSGRISGVRHIKELIENKSEIEIRDKILSDVSHMLAGGGILFLMMLFSVVTRSIFPATYALIGCFIFALVNRLSEYYFNRKIRKTKIRKQ
jgi:hypothetical protein